MFRNLMPLTTALLWVCNIFFSTPTIAQCLSFPVSFNERINGAQSLLLGKVVDKHTYSDEHGNIYTLNKMAVAAWIKNHNSNNAVYVITIGGVLGNKAQITYPAVQLELNQQYFMMLENDNHTADDRMVRIADPVAIQAMPYADAQGAWLLQKGKYHDLFTEGSLSEQELLQKLFTLAGLRAKKPDGSDYIPVTINGRTSQVNEVITFSPNPTKAGTINPADFLTITGSGFGSVPGTVEFPNADNGGSTFITPPNTTDYVSWTDNTIVVKVPTGQTDAGENRNAGTGTFIVNGVMASPQALVVSYAHISINTTFSGFSSRTRQRYYLRNKDGLGGYTFVYNTGFQSNAPAVAAFERAMNTWKCNTGINWRAAGTTSTGYDADGENVVLFDASLPAGILARATSRFNGASAGSCTLQNTVWWLDEVDVQVRSTGVNWQYGPALATASQYDFETVLLHELGHAHGLGHRIAPGQLMHYAVANASNIRMPAPQEIQGGQDKVAYSTMPTCFDPAGSGTPMIAAGCPFPVTLTSFTGVPKNEGVQLNWQTQHEINTSRFEVQRSNNGTTFQPIASVTAKGYPGMPAAYELLDVHMPAGTSYYRLKMIDKDGSYAYSSIIVVKVNAAVQPLLVHPNPVRNQLKIVCAINTNLLLADAWGRMIMRLPVKNGSVVFDASRLANGVYYLSDERSGYQTRIIVMH